MGLFVKRPLALFCAVFLLGALFLCGISFQSYLCIVIPLLVIGIFTLIVFLRRKGKQRRGGTVLLCAVALLIAWIYSFLTIALPQRKMISYYGDHPVLCVVTETVSENEYGGEYFVKVKQIDETVISCKAKLLVEFPAHLRPGDMVVADVTVNESDPTSYDERGAFLRLVANRSDRAFVSRLSDETPFYKLLFSECGISVITHRIRESIGNRLCLLLGEERGALASGFFMGDSSMVSSRSIRDFRRSGTSHQMAVSGLHVTVLLGSIDFLLKKIFVHKKIRCLLISLLGILFLFVTGFSSSACRSIFMLYFSYLCYLFFEDGDGVTFLFVSIFLLVLISPFSVLDLGMWMSFLATLGLLTVYPMIEEGIPYPRKGSTVRIYALRCLRRISLLSLMTVVSNLFLLPISWYYFGEVSLAAIPANLLISFPSFLFLICVPFVLLLGGIPFFGEITIKVISSIADLILWITRLFSSNSWATVSLKYDFVLPIMLVFSVLAIIVLLIETKKKWILVIPPAFATVAFVVGFTAFQLLNSAPIVDYRTENGNDMIAVTEGSAFSVCDISNGGYESFNSIKRELAESVACEMESLVLTHFHEGHLQSTQRLMEQVYIKTVYVPEPVDYETAMRGKLLWESAKECGSEIVFYKKNQPLALTASVRLALRNDLTRNGEMPLVSVYNAEQAFTYVNPSVFRGDGYAVAEARISGSDYTVFGAHGGLQTSSFIFSLEDCQEERWIIFHDVETKRNCFGYLGGSKTGIMKEQGTVRRFRVRLEKGSK